MPVPVPRILGHAADLGVLALEDLGDVTLQAHLGTGAAAAHAALYRQAVGFIDVLQRRGQELASPALHLVRHRLRRGEAHVGDGLLHQALPRGLPRRRVHRRRARGPPTELAAIVAELAAEPRVLCHRDYHSRNLMLHDGRLCIIDFQDARLGPDTYDLVSLLRDSYLDLPEQVVDELIAYLPRARRPRRPIRPSSGAGSTSWRCSAT